MRLAEYSVPKMNSAQAEEDGKGEPFFFTLAEGVSAFARRHLAAKILIVSINLPIGPLPRCLKIRASCFW